MTKVQQTNQSYIALVLDDFGELIKIRRDLFGQSRLEVSLRVGVPVSTISKLERGKAIRTDSLVKVFYALDLALEPRAKAARFELPIFSEISI